MIENVLKEVKSPFTDEFIHRLAETYIACGCDNGKLYRAINNVGMSNSADNSHTRELITYLLAGGERENDLSFERYALPYACEKKDRWIIMFSDRDPMAESTRNFDAPNPLIYRIYLNLKGKEKQDFILGYLNRCRADNVPYKFKFSRDDARNDQIILLSRAENLAQNLSIVEDITEGMQLGVLPMLVGEYKDGIGVAEEYYNRLWGYTDVKLALLRTSVKKYLCDHKDEFCDELSEEERKRLCTYIDKFDFLYEVRMKEKEDDEKEGYEFEDLDKRYYQKKGSIDCAKEHIENDGEAYMCGKGLVELGGAIRKIYAKNPEQFIREVINNFRTIGTQVWGFSSDLVFSSETEERFGKAGAYKLAVSGKEIGEENPHVTQTVSPELSYENRRATSAGNDGEIE